MDAIINTISYYFQAFTKPENLLLIILIGATVAIPLLVYYFQRRHIPKLSFDGLWKKPLFNGKGISYYLKVKRDKGEGGTQGVIGFVGHKDKELTQSQWFLSNSQETGIIKHDYLTLFHIINENEKKIIAFPENIFTDYPNPSEINLVDYDKNELVVQIEAIRGRIKKRQFKKKIKDIIKNAKPIPM